MRIGGRAIIYVMGFNLYWSIIIKYLFYPPNHLACEKDVGKSNSKEMKRPSSCSQQSKHHSFNKL